MAQLENEISNPKSQIINQKFFVPNDRLIIQLHWRRTLVLLQLH
jgi:hypothetical protein